MSRFTALLLLSTVGFAQTDWPSYGNDPGAMRYSSLRQIQAGNVGRLKLAWTFRTGKPGSETVPIVAGRAAVGSLGASGHSDANVTARVYSHALPVDDQRATDVWDSIVAAEVHATGVANVSVGALPTGTEMDSLGT